MKHITKLYLTSGQEKIRCQWRTTVISILSMYGALVLILAWHFDRLLSITAGIFFISILMQFSVTWLCAYKKPGTKLLSYILFVGPFSLLALFMHCLSASGLELLLGFVILIPFTWYYIASWRLRKVNKDIQCSNFPKS
jgi:hypothetical protein